MTGKEKEERRNCTHISQCFSVFQWLQEDYGVSYPTSSTGHASEVADASLPAGCTSAPCNIFQGVCPGSSNWISTNVLHCSLISLPVRFMLTQYTTSPKISTSPFQARSCRNMALAKRQVERLIYLKGLTTLSVSERCREMAVWFILFHLLAFSNIDMLQIVFHLSLIDWGVGRCCFPFLKTTFSY